MTTFGYNLAGQLTSVRDPENNDTTYARDLLGRVTQEENELGHSRYFVYDAASNLTLKKDRNARLTAYSFDDLNRLESENWLTGTTSLPSLAVANTTQGGPVNEVQRVGMTVSMAFTSGTFTLSFGGQTTSGIAYNASAATVQTALEALSSIGSGNIAVTKSQNTTTAQEWTLTFQGSLAGANQSQITINSSGVMGFMTVSNIQATDTNGNSGVNEVQTVTLSNATAGTFRLAFDNESTDPIAYNASAGTVQTAITGLSTIGSGNVSVSGSAGGPYTVTFQGALAGTNVATLQGDASHATSGSIGRTIAYTFDDASQLTAVSDPDSAYAYTYDAIGRLLTESNSGTSGVPTVVLTNTYDSASNRTRLSSTIGGTADFQNDYSYDNLLRLTRVDQIGQSGGNTVADKRVDFAYDDASRLTEVVRQYKPSGTWTEVATSAFSYDTIDRLTGIDHKQGGTSLFTPYSYTFDNANRITGITSQDGTVAYTYDATSQITGADYSFQTDEAFSWSANGNRTNTGYTTGTNNKMTSDGVYNYTYDNEGNLILRVKISDGSRREFTWDYRNRLTNITERATQYGAATMTVDYVYDTFDRRISKSFDADGAGGGSAVTSRYVFDGSATDVVLQFDGSNNLVKRDLWAEAVGLIAEENASNNSILWGLADNLGTIRDIADSTGTVQNHLTYDAFDNVTAETNSAINYLLGSRGMVRDEETGNSYAWFRYTINGHWLSEDPIGFSAGDTNISRVTGNDPVNLIDPTGLWGKPSGGKGSNSNTTGNPNKVTKPDKPRAPSGLGPRDLLVVIYVEDMLDPRTDPGNAKKRGNPFDGKFNVGHVSVGVGGFDSDGKTWNFRRRGFYPSSVAYYAAVANAYRLNTDPGATAGLVLNDNNKNGTNIAATYTMRYQYIVTTSRDGQLPPRIADVHDFMDNYTDAHQYDATDCNCVTFALDTGLFAGGLPFDQNTGMITLKNGTNSKSFPTANAMGDDLLKLGDEEIELYYQPPKKKSSSKDGK